MDFTDMLSDAVVALRRNRFIDPLGAAMPDMQKVLAAAMPVNCSSIHDDVLASDKAMDLYGDSIVRPPWMNCLYAYRPHIDRPTVMMIHVVTIDRDDYPEAPEWDESLTWESDSGTHTIDWSTVRYVSLATVHAWRPDLAGVMGPLHSWRWAATEDGVMQDFYEQYLDDRTEPGTYHNGMLTMLHSLTFLNCRNVTLVEPHRPRAQRRRLERAGVRISEIHVFPSGVTVRGRSMPVGAGGRPLHSVRGHIARYGPKWGRGLLFGKHEGEFWIPQHARGAAERGTVEQSVTIEAAS